MAGGLDVRECTFDYDEAGGRITHVPSGSHFLFADTAGHYTATAVVGDSPSWPYEAFSWRKVEELVQHWARYVKHEVETPDLWAELQREREILTGARYEDVENTPFTSDEQAEIAEQIQQIKAFMKEKYSLSEAQMLSLEAKLDDIEAAAGRIGRKDWQLLFLGVIFTAIVSGLLPPEAVRHIFVTALHSLDQLFGGGGVQQQLPPI